MYIAEAGINSRCRAGLHDRLNPVLLGRIPTDWYPTAVTLSSDNNTLFIANAKGVGEDVNPNTNTQAAPVPQPPTGLISTPQTDSNYIFGSVQKLDLTNYNLDLTTVPANNYKTIETADTSVVPIGGGPSARVKHVIFILQENKTFDSMLGSLPAAFRQVRQPDLQQGRRQLLLQRPVHRRGPEPAAACHQVCCGCQLLL